MSAKHLNNELALLNPYNSVVKVISKIENNESRYLVGIKDVYQIPTSIMDKLSQSKRYIHHTNDVHALGGRAIDLALINPISGRYMTGSSSGTALNVAVGINDLGIGTDGGGSVLAPALAVQCFGMICPLIEQEHMKQFLKHSTDGIEFSPSIGFISKDLGLIKDAYELLIGSTVATKGLKVSVMINDDNVYPFETNRIETINTNGTRSSCIRYLQSHLSNCDVLITNEGPIDTQGFGDTIYGHFDDETQQQQVLANKGLIRVVNMVNASCIVVPKSRFACGFALICESKKDKIAKAFKLAEDLSIEQDKLLKNYFLNLEMYFSKGYGE